MAMQQNKFSADYCGVESSCVEKLLYLLHQSRLLTPTASYFLSFVAKTLLTSSAQLWRVSLLLSRPILGYICIKVYFVVNGPEKVIFEALSEHILRIFWTINLKKFNPRTREAWKILYFYDKQIAFFCGFSIKNA